MTECGESRTPQRTKGRSGSSVESSKGITDSNQRGGRCTGEGQSRGRDVSAFGKGSEPHGGLKENK